MKKFLLATVMIGALAVSGCESLSQNGINKQEIGTGAGAVIGGILGSRVGGGSGQLWATGAGAVIGGLLGNNIGQSLDRADQAFLNQANQRAHTAPVGESVSWNNPDTGNYGTVTPIRDGQSSAGRYCREYEQDIYIAGQKETAVGTACQNTDGSWEIMN